jgi:hypothetical protein
VSFVVSLSISTMFNILPESRNSIMLHNDVLNQNFLFNYRRSEFLGCLMIPVKMTMRKTIAGSFLLHPQMSLSNPSPLIPETDLKILNNSLDAFKENCEDVKKENVNQKILR